jgi:hypothetical protein
MPCGNNWRSLFCWCAAVPRKVEHTRQERWKVRELSGGRSSSVRIDAQSGGPGHRPQRWSRRRRSWASTTLSLCSAGTDSWHKCFYRYARGICAYWACTEEAGRRTVDGRQRLTGGEDRWEDALIATAEDAIIHSLAISGDRGIVLAMARMRCLRYDGVGHMTRASSGSRGRERERIE